MLIAILSLLGISLLIVIHELGHFIAAKQAGVRVDEFGFGFPPRIKGWKRGETTYSINWLPFGGFVRIYGENKERAEEAAVATGESVAFPRAFFYQPIWKRFVIIFAGIAINFFAGWLLLSLVYAIGDRPRVLVTALQEGSPAAQVGMQLHDEIVGFKDADSFVAFTKERQNEEVRFTVARGGEAKDIVVRLRESTKEGQGALGAAVSNMGFERLSPLRAVVKAFTDAVHMVADIFIALGSLMATLFTTGKVPENIVGPIGILGIAGGLAELGFVYVLQLIASISLNLVALNALPIPALDGGRALFLLIEKIKGSPLKPKQEFIFNLTSFGILIVLMLFITGRDIIRLF